MVAAIKVMLKTWRVMKMVMRNMWMRVAKKMKMVLTKRMVVMKMIVAKMGMQMVMTMYMKMVLTVSASPVWQFLWAASQYTVLRQMLMHLHCVNQFIAF